MSMPFYVPPEQLVKDRAEFARKGIRRGRPIVVLRMDAGILLVGENNSSTLRKISEVYDRIAFAGVGRFNEFEALRVAGIRYADLKGYSYSRSDVTGKGLANAYSQTLGQVFSHEVKPYEIEIVVAEVGENPSGDNIYRIQFDGTLRDVGSATVLGSHEDEILAALDGSWSSDMAVGEAFAAAAAAVQTGMEESVALEDWETGFLDRSADRRAFRRLGTDEIREALGE